MILTVNISEIFLLNYFIKHLNAQNAFINHNVQSVCTELIQDIQKYLSIVQNQQSLSMTKENVCVLGMLPFS